MATERANVTTFVCCDKVIEEAGNHKKTVIGIFRNFGFQELPARLAAPWFIYAQISSLDPGAHDMTINVVHDETTGVVFAAGLEIPDSHPPDIDLIVPAQPAEFHKEGKHVVTLNIDGGQAAYCVLTVSLRRQQIGGK
jgi:hypothetical protein